ncbi:hypothetical protein [Acinetobacter sp. MD2(2019)]|uniref:hypothetical protein n=1 Tax=Acinetobacter sp. MD2(2019) TaxID=2605273 RepID=UPI002D1F20AC|nr:hypothetical protein [Acinetobacter sp. MD2(2019)]MEB3754013.1 hypothetical protein [Acinetobacter sp. MD2(2019)]
MSNELKTYSSDNEVIIDLKMNGDNLLGEIHFSFLMLLFYDAFAFYMTYELLMSNQSISFISILMILITSIGIIYFHYEHNKKKKWIIHAHQIFYFSKNKLIIVRKCLDEELARTEIDTQEIVKIKFSHHLGDINPPFLPDYCNGNIHIYTYNGITSFAINLNKKEAKSLIQKITTLIMQFHDPKNYIFSRQFEKQ